MTRVLAYVEDPGAANMVLGLAAALKERGAQLDLRAGGTATDFLKDRGEAVAGGPDAAALAGACALCVGTSEDPTTPAFALIAEAKRRGLPTAVVIDGPAAADRRLKGATDDPLAHASDWLLVPDRATGAAYAALGFPATRLRLCGHPSLDRAAAEGAALAKQGRAALRRACFPELADDRPLFLFLTELSDGLDPAQFRRSADYTLTGRGGADGRTEIVLEEVLDAAARLSPRPHVALRLHPKTPRGLYAPYDGEIAAWSSGGAPYEPLMAADLVVGLTTALLFEAAVMGCNALSVAPRAAERDWLASNTAGITPFACTRGDLGAALARALNDPKGFMPAMPPGALHLGAAGRIADILVALAAGREPPA